MIVRKTTKELSECTTWLGSIPAAMSQNRHWYRVLGVRVWARVRVRVRIKGHN